MSIPGEYVPSALAWVAEQVAEYEASGGSRANTVRDTDIPIIVVTMLGKSSGKVRKIGLIRVENDGQYALIASKGGQPKNPAWYYNMIAHPEVLIQDGPQPHEFVVREVFGAEREEWFARGASVLPSYLDYQATATRVIPVLVATPA